MKDPLQGLAPQGRRTGNRRYPGAEWFRLPENGVNL